MSNPQVRDGYFAKSDFHPALKFSYSPVDFLEREKIQKLFRESLNNPEKKTEVVTATVKNHLAAWDANQSHVFSFNPAKDQPGEELPLKLSNVKLLIPNLIERLFFLLIGTEASDPVPGATDEEADEHAAMLKQASDENAAPGLVQQEAAIKNS